MDAVTADRRVVRIEDVAMLAGVSIATVSRALTMPSKLRPATLARVEEAVRQTGYTPNLAARSLRARRSMMVLVVVPDIANPFFSDVLRGIDQALVAHGYGLLIGNLNGDLSGKARHVMEIVRAGQVDGVLLLNGTIPAHDGRKLTELGIPLVAICEAIGGATFPQVEVQNRAGATAAVRHLTDLGHSRLGYLAGPADNILNLERLGGFCDGLAIAGVAMSDAIFWPGNFTFQAGEAAAATFLALPSGPTAVFAANDEMAIGFISGLRAAGIRVPEDVSVVGFDGIDFGDYVAPRLTTFRQPRRALGIVGAGLLVRAMAGEAISPSEAHQQLPVELKLRASTAQLLCAQ